MTATSISDEAHTIRKAFWLLSTSLHLWASNAAPISASASPSRWWSGMELRIAAFADAKGYRSAVYAPKSAFPLDGSLALAEESITPVEIKRHHYIPVQLLDSNSTPLK